MSLAIRLAAEPVRSLAFGSISGTYMGIGSVIDESARTLLIQNLTDGKMMVSLNGVDDHFPIPIYGYILFDITYNKEKAQGYFLDENRRVYVKEIDPPTLGSVYVTVFYGKRG